jgi:hypothetical protein
MVLTNKRGFSKRKCGKCSPWNWRKIKEDLVKGNAENVVPGIGENLVI